MAERKKSASKKPSTRHEPSRAELVKQGKALVEAGERVLGLAQASKEAAERTTSPRKASKAPARSKSTGRSKKS